MVTYISKLSAHYFYCIFYIFAGRYLSVIWSLHFTLINDDEAMYDGSMRAFYIAIACLFTI